MSNTIKSLEIEIKSHVNDKNQAIININGLNIAVVVLDVRKVYGRIDVEITPIKGSNTAWVELSKLKPYVLEEHNDII